MQQRSLGGARFKGVGAICGAMPISNIVLDNDHRAVAILLRANTGAKVCVVQFRSEICV
nr:MAG TPA: hypothetical protein [Caudoviricetes sp.]